MIYPLWHQYPEIYPKLQHVQALLTQRTRIRQPLVGNLLTQQINAGGKMLRSGLMLMFAQFGDFNRPELISGGAAIEALHLATLIHDDVLDHADARRGVDTIHSQADNRAAIYAGDFLFSVYFELMAQSSPDVANVGTNAMTMRRIFLGELDQNGQTNQRDLTVHQYLRQISGKTAALFALATYQGVRISQADPSLFIPAYRFGRYLGMSFQMIDDLLDYTGSPSQTQKPVFEDLQNGIYTLPLLYALETDRASLTPHLNAAQTDPQELAFVIERVRRDGIPQATALAEKYTQKALATLAAFPKGETRDALLTITNTMLNRKL
ncbi:polyprenyl synthetase family protein [Lacticaseibacillus brantae]|uniref:Octaprenyl-diphosphate synthase n=1 Tax=Lacticaseibacillus brantae DSM 23927 TaxID=1423727 RepID=A0A0R2B8W0_9LACO|nr:polyprenyl synthetase family protein [Lacticaseibacillus brantae]KRM72028.1 Octaprenyl-diphosphate synthase [Lacticaseibacillus brantae DSM 23927]